MYSSRLIVWISIAIVLLVILTQITVPAIRGTKLFPFFRRSSRKLAKETVEWNQQLYEEQMRTELAELVAGALASDRPDTAVRYETEFSELIRKHKAGELTDAQLQHEWGRIYVPKLNPYMRAR